MEIFNLLNENTVQCIVNEAYYGSSGKPIQKTRKAFQEFYDLAKSNVHKSPLGTSQLKGLQDAIAEQFGFKKVTILPAPSTHPFIFALPAYVSYKDKGKIIEETQYGVRFSDNSKYSMSIYLPNSAFNDVTSDELFAVLLHEIGHSFVSILNINYHFKIIELCYSIVNEIKSYVGTRANDTIASISDMLTDSKTMLAILNATYSLSSYILNNKVLRFIRAVGYAKSAIDAAKYVASIPDIIGNIFKTSPEKNGGRLQLLYNNINPQKVAAISNNKKLQELYKNIKPVLNLFKNISYKGTMSINSSISTKTGSEYFSDSFAVMYGYGPQLASGLSSLTKYRTENSMTGLLNSLGDLQLMLVKVDHPDSYQRIMSMIAHLKQELQLNKLLDNESKIEITNQISTLEDELNSILKNKDRNIICSLYSSLMKIKKNETQKAIDKNDYSFGLKRE